MGFNLPPKRIVLGIDTFDLNQLIRVKRGFIGSLRVQAAFIGRDKKAFVIPEGTTAKVRMLKPDMKKVLNDTEQNGVVEGNAVTFKITDQMQAYPGEGALEIILFNGGETVTSSTCGIKIIENVHDDSGLESTDEWLTVINTLAVLEEKIQDANEAIENANEAAEQIINETLMIYKPNVVNYAAIATTYPNPEKGWVTVANDTKIRWRYNGTEWVNSGTVTTDPIATETTPGNVQGNGNVKVKTDGAMWADQYKDKATATGTSVQFTDADDALIAITAIGGTGSVTMEVCKENLLDPSGFKTSYTLSGLTITRSSNNTITLNGTTTAIIDIYLILETVSSTFYTKTTEMYNKVKSLNGSVTMSNNLGLLNYFGKVGGGFVQNTIETAELGNSFIRIPSGTTYTNTVLNVQIEFGSISTPYKQYYGNQLTINDVTTATYPVYLTSYKGITNVFTLNTGQPTFTAIAKSELWARDYLQDLHIADIKDSNVTFTDAVADGTITSGSKISTIIGLIKYKLSALATAVAGKIDKTSISTTDTENSTTKVAAAAVTYALGQEIDNINNAFVQISLTMNATYLSELYGDANYHPYAVKTKNMATITGNFAVSTTISTAGTVLLSGLPSALRHRWVSIFNIATGVAYSCYLSGTTLTIGSLPTGNYYINTSYLI